MAKLKARSSSHELEGGIHASSLSGPVHVIEGEVETFGLITPSCR